MDFFAQQDLARRNTRLLVVLFLAAVLLLVVLTNVVIAAFLFFGEDYNVYSGSDRAGGFLSYFSWERFGLTGLAVTLKFLGVRCVGHDRAVLTLRLAEFVVEFQGVPELMRTQMAKARQ